MKTNQTEYTISNFTAVNDFIDEEKRYASHFRKFKIARLFKRYALYSSLFILCFAILILFCGVAYWLWQSKPNQIFKSSTTNVTNYHITEDVERAKKILNDINNNTVDVSKNIEREFVIFQSKPYELENGQQGSVVTGWSYDPDQLDYPQKQYCYLSFPSESDLEISMRVNLMDKVGKSNPTENLFDDNKVGYYDFEIVKSKWIWS